MTATFEFGLPAGLRPELYQEVAQELRRLGYEGLWVNDTETGDGLAALAAVADSPLQLGVGVLGLDRWSPRTIANRVRELQLPVERLALGVGSGASARPLALVRSGLVTLRRELPDAQLWIAALGPRMRQLGSELADGVLLNWLSPEAVAVVREHVWAVATTLGRKRPVVGVYVRSTTGRHARERLEREYRSYSGIPVYRRHFDRMSARGPTGYLDPMRLAGDLAAYAAAADRLVIRAVPSRLTADAVLGIARAAAEGMRLMSR